MKALYYLLVHTLLTLIQPLQQAIALLSLLRWEQGVVYYCLRVIAIKTTSVLIFNRQILNKVQK